MTTNVCGVSVACVAPVSALRFASVCAGICAASVAWKPLGWAPVWYSEIEPFPAAVLAARHPGVPNMGDMLAMDEEELRGHGPLDVLVGGTPCQSFSLAGLRGGLGDARGNLALRFVQLAQLLRPEWVVWENVPGVFSSGREGYAGEDYGAILRGLRECGYQCFWRVLDAQYFGVPQRRRRVFVVGHRGDWRRACAVLLERHCLRGDPPPSREARSRIAGSFTRGLGSGGADLAHAEAGWLQAVAPSVTSKWAKGTGGPSGDECQNLIVAQCHGGSVGPMGTLRTGGGTPIIPILEAGKRCGRRGSSRDGVGVGRAGDPMFTLQAGAQHAIAFDERQITSKHNRSVPGVIAPTMHAHGPATIAFDARQSDVVMYGECGGPLDTDGFSQAIAMQESQSGTRLDELAGTLRANGSGNDKVGTNMCVMRPGAEMQVRRLTPRECERLQGFPDDYTLITYRGKPAADAPRYKAIGNSMAVPVMDWIGRRIELVERLAPRSEACGRKAGAV